MTANILMVDDDQEIAELVEIYLRDENFNVTTASSGEEVLELLKTQSFDLAILDIMMPGMNGYELMAEIRKTLNIPIIMLSAKSKNLDKIRGLSLGADDYMTKPFDLMELLARVKSQLRRYTKLNPDYRKKEDSRLEYKGLVVDKTTHRVTLDDEEIRLTPLEFDILAIMISEPGRVFSTEELFQRVWKEEVIGANNTVMVHIRRLRSKLHDDEREEKLIETVWGVGYRIGE